jgi:hypothetical protein
MKTRGSLIRSGHAPHSNLTPHVLNIGEQEYWVQGNYTRLAEKVLSFSERIEEDSPDALKIRFATGDLNLSAPHFADIWCQDTGLADLCLGTQSKLLFLVSCPYRRFIDFALSEFISYSPTVAGLPIFTLNYHLFLDDVLVRAILRSTDFSEFQVFLLTDMFNRGSKDRATKRKLGIPQKYIVERYFSAPYLENIKYINLSQNSSCKHLEPTSQMKFLIDVEDNIYKDVYLKQEVIDHVNEYYRADFDFFGFSKKQEEHIPHPSNGVNPKELRAIADQARTLTLKRYSDRALTNETADHYTIKALLRLAFDTLRDTEILVWGLGSFGRKLVSHLSTLGYNPFGTDSVSDYVIKFQDLSRLDKAGFIESCRDRNFIIFVASSTAYNDISSHIIKEYGLQPGRDFFILKPEMLN